MERASVGDLNQIPLADMNVYPVTFTPKEWVAESVVAPVCKVPCSELLVLSRCSDPSLNKPLASRVVDCNCFYNPKIYLWLCNVSS